MLPIEDVHAAVDAFAEEFGLSLPQQAKVKVYAVRHGLDRVQEIAGIVRSKPRDNLAATFLAGIRDDWQKPKSTVAKKVARKVSPPAPVPEPVEAIDWETLRRRWAASTDAQREQWVPYETVRFRMTRSRYATDPGLAALGTMAAKRNTAKGQEAVA